MAEPVPGLSRTSVLSGSDRHHEQNEVESALRDEDFAADLLESSDRAVATLVRLWAEVDALRQLDPQSKAFDAEKHHQAVAVLYKSFVAPDARTRVEVSRAVSDGLAAALDAPQLAPGALDPLHTELLALLTVPVMAVLNGQEHSTASARKVRDWVRGSTSDDAHVRERLLAQRATLAPLLSDVDKLTVAQLNTCFRVLQPLLLVYREKGTEVDLERLFARLQVVDPLSPDLLRRQALIHSFTKTHARELSTEMMRTLTRTVTSFHLSSEAPLVSEKLEFNNAIEAFAQGRSHNPRQKSRVDMSDVIESLALFNGLKYDPVLRKELLEVEHKFESSRVMQATRKVFWYWALHCYWIAQVLMARCKAAAAHAFLLAACDKCRSALQHKPDFLKPLFLWGDVLYVLLTDKIASAPPVEPGMDGRNDNSNHKSGKKKGDKKESPLRGAVVGYLSALVGFAQHLPHMVDFDMLRRLADVTGHADIAPLDLARALFSLVSKCRSANLRQRACVLLLEWERDGRCKLAALQHMYSAVDVSPREALHHVQSFVALFHYNEGSSDDLIAPLETVAGVDASAESKLARRKRSVWMPDPSATVEKELRAEDPKKAYSIHGEIGHGGFGSVKLARMRNGDVPVAIKIINKPLSEARETILAEVQIMKMCNHRHIVDLVDALVWKDVCYLVMRYCDGGSLEMLIEAVTLTDPQISHIFRRVASALGFLEQCLLVHRDVKPANILLSKDGSIRLGDLGLLKPQVEARLHRSYAGTALFRAPEVLLGQGSSCRSDMYSFGCTLYATIYNTAPYSNLSAPMVLWKVTTQSKVPPPPPKCKERPSAACTALMARCFVVDPVLRVSASEVKEDPYFQLDTEDARASIHEICDVAFLADALTDFGMKV